MVGYRSSFSHFVYSGQGRRCVRSLILEQNYVFQFSIPLISSAKCPMFLSRVSSSGRLPRTVAFSSSAEPPHPPAPKISSSSSSSHEFPPPPPINPPETENPDPATLREQWSYATRMYSRWYGHAWGTAILAGVSFYALGWLIKGGNPVKRTLEEEKKEEEK